MNAKYCYDSSTITSKNLSEYLNRINYSASNEDTNSERTALQIQNSDTVLCLTGSGDRVLSLIVDQPKKLSA